MRSKLKTIKKRIHTKKTASIVVFFVVVSFLLGPLQGVGQESRTIFQETRQWQIASDSPGTQVKTVEFFLYQYGGAPSTVISNGEGMDSDTYDQVTYPSTVTINLPESDVVVKRAIVQWTSNIHGKSADITDSDWVFTRDDGEGGEYTITDNDDVEFVAGIDVKEKAGNDFTRFIDVTSAVEGGSHTYSFDAQYTGDDRTNDSAKLYITYEYTDTSSTQLKTVRYFVGCDTDFETSDTDIGFDGDDFDTYTVNPNLNEGSISIQSHWIEMTLNIEDSAGNKTDSQFRVDYAGDDPEEEGTASWIDSEEKDGKSVFMMEQLGSTNINLESNNTIKLGFTTATADNAMDVEAMCGEWVITYEYDWESTADDDAIHTRTVRYFMGTMNDCETTDCRLPTSYTEIGTEDIHIPEEDEGSTDFDFKSVWVRYNFGYFNNKANRTFTPRLTIDADGDAYQTTGDPFNYKSQKKNTVASVAMFEVTSHFDTNWDPGDDVKIEAIASASVAGSDLFILTWAELVVTYEFNAEDNSSDDIKTVMWWVDNSTQGRASDFEDDTDAWDNTFDTFIPESGDLTWRSSAVIAKYHVGNNNSKENDPLYTITISDSGEGGSDVQSAEDVEGLKAETFLWMGVETDSQMAPSPLTGQSNIDFNIEMDTYDTGETVCEIMPAPYAYTTYQYDGPEVSPPGIDISGNVLGTDESAWIGNPPCNGSTENVRIVVDATTVYTTSCAIGTGYYEKTEVVAASGAIITVWLNTNGANVANTVTKSAGSNISDLDLYEDRLIVRYEIGDSLTNSDLVACDQNSGEECSDANDLFFTSDEGTLTLDSGKELHIWTGKVFAPGGNVSTPHLHIKGTDAEYSGGSETLTLSGSGTGTFRPLYVEGGTFSANTNTTKFTGTSATEIQGTTYNNLTLSPTITEPIVYTGGGDITVNSALDINPTAYSALTLTFQLGGATVVTGNTTVHGVNSGAGILNTNNFSFNEAGVLTIGSVTNNGTLTAGSSTITFSGSDTPFILTADKSTFNANTSTVKYTADADTNITATDYCNLELGP